MSSTAGVDGTHPLARNVATLRGVGPALAERLQRLGIERLVDLLLHLPTRYEDRTRVVPLGTLRPGARAVVEGEVQHSETVYRRRRTLLVAIDDGSGARLTLRFFHFSRAQQESLSRGQRLRAFGEVRSGPNTLEMVHPEYQLMRGKGDFETPDHLTAIYPVTDGITLPRLRALIGQALQVLARHPLADPLTDATGLAGAPSLGLAISTLHRPPAQTDLAQLEDGRHPAQRRLAFEELLAHQLSQRLLRASLRTDPSPAIHAEGELLARLLASLSFELTAAQRRVIDEIIADLGRGSAMLRLVQGDVGSGKTLVALAAGLIAVEAGYQVALMAPTELLAEQHAISFDTWLRPLGVLSIRLTGRLKAAERRSALAAIASGEAQVVVGTHALFQEGVHFARLGVVVIDEQHRFGVHQRLALRDKGLQGAQGQAPHQLVMTATPIPRTLAMSAYADLDTSVIDELPPGRTPVRTAAVPTSRREELVARIAEQCRGGAQVYWVCPLIEESEHLNVSAAQVRADSLREALPSLSVLLLHGRMASTERTSVMADFKAGRGDILVATTVIEVGVDVPNASLMIIENAERLGLAQLHQLRGRVGRGTAASSCVLLYEPPLGQLSRARLDIMRRSTDGFEIAEKDLELRGPGEVLGTRQTGVESFRVADLVRDADLLPEAQALADELLAGAAGAAGMVTLLTDRWVGRDARYGVV